MKGSFYPLASIHQSAWKKDSAKFGVAISSPRHRWTANKPGSLAHRGLRMPDVATNGARNRCKRLLLATDQLPENFRKGSRLSGCPDKAHRTGAQPCSPNFALRGF